MSLNFWFVVSSVRLRWRLDGRAFSAGADEKAEELPVEGGYRVSGRTRAGP